MNQVDHIIRPGAYATNLVTRPGAYASNSVTRSCGYASNLITRSWCLKYVIKSIIDKSS